MPHERTAAPWAGATYNGYSGPQAVPPRAPPPGDRPSLSKKTLLGGLAAAVAGGLLFGLWVRPDTGDDRTLRAPTKAAPAATVDPSPAEVMPVEVLPPVMTPPPTSDGPLEVLPQDLARAAEAARPRAPAVVVRSPPPAQVARAAPGAPASAVVRDPRPAQVAVIAPRPAPPMADADRDARPSFNCRYARSPAERMVCGDSELARLDRRLNRSFQQAVGSGIPYRELRAEQDDWLNIREDAARRSPEAVASVYRQRIRELNALAETY